MKDTGVSKHSINRFKKILTEYKTAHGLRDMPWRRTKDPYHILISEIMLQQTQVPRVIEKYKIFLKAFPKVEDLARAPLRDVLALWSGLGYNRRAKFLQQCAIAITNEYNSKFPKTIPELEKLPGVGPYTARAVAAFAYNIPSVLFETNIRTVFIHYFFPEAQEKISDIILAPYVEACMDKKNPREWYWLLMDYGTYLKSTGVKTHAKSTMFTRQTKFAGSFRQIRGGILKLLIQKPYTEMQLIKALQREQSEVSRALGELIAEKLIQKNGQKYSL